MRSSNGTSSHGRRLVIYVGARPNAPKLWTLLAALREHASRRASTAVTWRVVHSGQHYDPLMGLEYCRELGLRFDAHLRVGPTQTDGAQLAKLITMLEADLALDPPSGVVTLGDVNTTLAAAIVAARNGYPVIHVEAGLRSAALTPEEVNRRLITRCSDYHLAPSARARDNLLGEGIGHDRIFLVGNLMAECYLRHAAARSADTVLNTMGLTPRQYVVVTLHKSASLEDAEPVLRAVATLAARGTRVVFPCHPHTRNALSAAYPDLLPAVRPWLVPPQSYVPFGRLLDDSRLVITDSDGVQEECAVAGVPCITVATDTARPETVESGSNRVVGRDLRQLLGAVDATAYGSAAAPQYWDDRVSARIADALEQIVGNLPLRGGRQIRATPSPPGFRSRDGGDDQRPPLRTRSSRLAPEPTRSGRHPDQPTMRSHE